MVKLNQTIGDYYLRFASIPDGDMQQILEGQAIVSYNVSTLFRDDASSAPADCIDGFYHAERCDHCA